VARSQRRSSASVLPAGSGTGRGVEQVEALLGGERLDAAGLRYDLDATHVALIAVGPEAAEVVDEILTGMSDSLVVWPRPQTAWCWAAGRDGFGEAAMRAISAVPPRGTRLAAGEPASGLAGWRLTHHQARAALPVALRGPVPAVRYRDVALVATLLKDELLATSLRRLYLEPLEAARGGGEELRLTLRAYFAADRNLTVAAERVGVTRQAVARRLRAVEERLGRPIAALGADLEIALRLQAVAG
jgi:sugar diacid utilization regulator